VATRREFVFNVRLAVYTRWIFDPRFLVMWFIRPAFGALLSVIVTNSPPRAAGGDPAWRTAVRQGATDTPRLIEILTDADSGVDRSRLAALLTALRTDASARELHWIAGSTLSGTVDQVMAIFEYPDFASLERGHEVRQAVWHRLPAAVRPRLESQIWQLSPDQTFGDGLVPWSSARAMTILAVSVSNGGYDEYAEQQQLAAQLLAKAHVTDEEWLGYSLRFGPGAPAFIFVAPLRSIAALDSAASHGDVLPPVVDRARDAALRESVLSSSTTLLTLRPELGSSTR
jgi:hypothetical protein